LWIQLKRISIIKKKIRVIGGQGKSRWKGGGGGGCYRERVCTAMAI